MSPFRDELVAALARVERLEDEPATLRGRTRAPSVPWRLLDWVVMGSAGTILALAVVATVYLAVCAWVD